MSGLISLGNGMEIGEFGSSSAVTDDMNHYSESEITSGCSNMDANCLRLYLNKHMMDHTLFPQMIMDALKCAPDPAMLVFILLQTFNIPHSSTTEKTSCIFLLEQLTKLQKYQSGKVEQVLQISQDMKIRALSFACRWKSRLTQQGLRPLEVYGFLQFLVSYNLASLFDGDELLQLFKVFYDAVPVYCPEKSPHLCRVLGLINKIPDLINSLIKKDLRLQAAKYICAFMEEPHFPLALLLNDHVKFIQQRVENIRVSKDQSLEKFKATFELLHLREVLQYINDYKLEVEYSPNALESRIIQLEAIMADFKGIPTEVPKKRIKLPINNIKIDGAKVDSPENLTDKKGSPVAVDSHGMTKRNACSQNSAIS